LRDKYGIYPQDKWDNDAFAPMTNMNKGGVNPRQISHLFRFKYRQTCLKMTLDVGNFLILHVAQLSVRYLTYQNYFLFILIIVYA